MHWAMFYPVCTDGKYASGLVKCPVYSAPAILPTAANPHLAQCFRLAALRDLESTRNLKEIRNSQIPNTRSPKQQIITKMEQIIHKLLKSPNWYQSNTTPDFAKMIEASGCNEAALIRAHPRSFALLPRFPRAHPRSSALIRAPLPALL